MKRKKLYGWIGLILVVSGLAGCKVLSGLFRKVQPTITVRKVMVDSLSVDKVYLRGVLAVRNPSQLAVSLPAVNYEIRIAGARVATGSKKNVRLRADTLVPVSLPIAFSWQDVRKVVRNLEGKDSVHYLFSGMAQLNAEAFGTLEIPFEYESVLPVVKPLRFSLRDLYVYPQDQALRVETTLQVENPNSFDLVIRRLYYALQVEGLVPVEIEAKSKVSLPARGKAELPIIATVDLGQLAAYLLARSYAKYAISGTVEAEVPDYAGAKGKLAFPFELKGELSW